MREPDTRMWRCMGCGIQITWDSESAQGVKVTASPDFGTGRCVGCREVVTFRKTDVRKKKP